MTGPALTWPGRPKVVVATLAVVALAVALLGVAVPAAHAATYTYANDISTPEGQARDSGRRATISGGSASVALGFGSVTITTYYPYPGYTTVAEVTSDASATAHITHSRKTDARSKCHWYWQNVGGSAKLTCSVTS